MTTAILAWTLAGASALAFTVVLVRRVSAPVWVSMAVALVLRVAFALVVSHRYTPKDVRVYFRETGVLIGYRKDPLGHMPGREWNFLPLMPYVHHLELKTGLPWVLAVKIAPIAADVAIVWLVSRLAARDGASRALQYAVNPVSLFVAALHGQVEPVALALGLGGVLLATRNQWFRAGLLLGAAVAAKTWPALLVLAVLPLTRIRRLAWLLAGTAVVPLAVLASGVMLLDTQPVAALAHVATYTGYAGSWGWAGVLHLAGVPHMVGYTSRVGRLGSVLTGVAVIVAVVAFRRRDLPVRGVAALTAFLIVTAGFGPQYLMWPLPLLIAVGRWSRLPYVLAAGAFVAISYLIVLPHPNSFPLFGTIIRSFVVIGALIAVLVDLARQGKPEQAGDAAVTSLAAALSAT